MGQKISKYTRGDYDAIVYLVGSEIVAEDNLGRKIASGVSGIDDEAVIISAQLVGNNVYIDTGTYSVSSTITVTKNLTLSNGCKFIPIANVDMLQIKPGGSICGGKIDTTGMAYSSSAILFDGSDKFNGFTNGGDYNEYHVRDVSFYGVADQGVAIHLKSDDATYGCIYGILIENVRIFNMQFGILMSRTGDYGDNWVNGNTIRNVWGYNTKYFIYQSRTGGLAGNDMDGNRFDFDYQKGPNSTMAITLDGRYNIINAFIWDWAVGTAIEVSADSAENVITSTITRSLITNTNVLNKFKYIPGYSPRHLIISRFGGDFITLSSALLAISPTAGEPYVIDLMDDVTDTAMITLKSYVTINGNGRTITSTCTSNFGISGTDLVSVLVQDLNFVMTNTGNYKYGLYIHGCNNTVRFDNVKITNSTTGTGSIGFSLECSQMIFDNCSFIGGIGDDSVGCYIYGATAPSDTSVFNNCYAKGGTGLNSHGWEFVSTAANVLRSCIGEAGIGAGSLSYKISATATIVFRYCLQLASGVYTGYGNVGFGTSTGTGSLQTIHHLCHGSLSTNTIVTIEIPSTGYKGSCTFDVDHIYPLVKNGVAFNWKVEVI